METGKEYFAFISYSRKDEAWAKWLAHELEHYHLPLTLDGRDDLPEDLRPIFRDIDELSAGNLPSQIKRALESSKNLIVICSPNSAKSQWVNKEVKEFIGMGKIDKVFPFIIEGVPNSNNDANECLPKVLRTIPSNKERLGVSISEYKSQPQRLCKDCPLPKENKKQGDVNDKGRDAAVVKIVAGMLGLGFDTLWQRYEKEKAEEEQRIIEQRNKILTAQSRFLAEKINTLVAVGDSYTARLLALEALPKQLATEEDRPLVEEAKEAFMKASLSNTAIINASYSYGSYLMKNVNNAFFSSNGKLIISRKKIGAEKTYFPKLLRESKSFLYSAHRNPYAIRCFDASSGAFISDFDGIRCLGLNNKFVFLKDNIDNNLNSYEIRDLETNQVVRKLHLEHGDVSFATFCWDNKRVIIVEEQNKELIVVDILNHEKSIIQVKYSGIPITLKCCSDKNVIVSYKKKNLRITSYNSEFSESHYLDYPIVIVDSVVVSNNAKYVAVSINKKNKTDNYFIYIWDMNNIISLIDNLYTEPASILSFSLDEKLLFSASMKNIHIWDVKEKKSIYSLPVKGTYKVSFSHNGDYSVISSANDIYIWSNKRREIIKHREIIEGEVLSVSIASNDNNIVYTVKRDSSIFLYLSDELDNLNSINKSIKIENSLMKIRYASISPNQHIIAYSSGKDIIICYLESNKPPMRLQGDFGDINFLSFCSDSSLIVSTTGIIRMWDINNGVEITNFMYNTEYGQIFYIPFVIASPSGNNILSITESGTIKIWDIKTRNEVYTFKGYIASYNKDGKLIASKSEDGIRIWSSQTGEEIIFIERVGRGYNEGGLSFSSDSRLLLSFGGDYIEVWRWRKQSKAILRRKWKVENDYIQKALFSPDENFVIAISTRFIYIWNINTEKLMEKISTNYEDKYVVIHSVFFSFNGELMVLSTVNSIYLEVCAYETLQSMIEKTRKRFANRLLTEEERKKYYLD